MTWLTADALFNRVLQWCHICVLGTWTLETRVHVGHLTMLYRLFLSQNRGLILALLDRIVWAARRETERHPATRRSVCCKYKQRHGTSFRIPANTTQFQFNFIICFIGSPVCSPWTNSTYHTLSSLVLYQLWVLTVYGFSSQILQLYTILASSSTLPMSIYCSAYQQLEDAG